MKMNISSLNRHNGHQPPSTLKAGRKVLRGFTLIEIMIVVAIIGMLATLAIPNFMKARETARRNACISNLRNIEGAVQQWALDMNKDEGSTVTYTDIKSYLHGNVVCPDGGSTFQDSYSITTVDAPPTCLRHPDTHKLPPEN
jgi:prepilin-type N-terminal cleavage/methylation domain-containing protein